jgi:hypothetical protein
MAVRAVGLGLIGAATTMLARTATRKAMHTRHGAARLPRAVRRSDGFGTMLLLALAAGAMLALGDVLQEQRTRAAHA